LRKEGSAYDHFNNWYSLLLATKSFSELTEKKFCDNGMLTETCITLVLLLYRQERFKGFHQQKCKGNCCLRLMYGVENVQEVIDF
jgi:hypothetical protein